MKPDTRPNVWVCRNGDVGRHSLYEVYYRKPPMDRYDKECKRWHDLRTGRASSLQIPVAVCPSAFERLTGIKLKPGEGPVAAYMPAWRREE